MPYRGWQNTRIPLVRGAREDIDPRVVPEGVFRSMRNVRFDKTGSLRAAPAYSWTGSTGFDDRFASSEPALANPHRIYSLNDQSLVSDGWLRTKTTAGSFKNVGPLPNVQTEPPFQLASTHDDSNVEFQDSDVTVANGFAFAVWIADDEVHASVHEVATGAVLIRDTLVSTASDVCDGPLVAAIGSLVAVFWAVLADNEVQATTINASASGIATGFGSPTVLVSDYNAQTAAHAPMDVSVTGTTGAPRFVMAYGKDDGANFEGIRVNLYNTGLTLQDNYELDLDAVPAAVGILGETNESQIWMAVSESANGTQIYLLDQALDLDANFPRVLDAASGSIGRVGLARVGSDLSSVLIAWQSDFSTPSATNQTGQISLNIQDDGGSASLTPTVYSHGIIAARPFAASDTSVWLPVILSQRSGHPQDVAGYVLDLVDADGAVRALPTPLAAYARSQVSYSITAIHTPPHWATIGGVSYGYAQQRAHALTDAETASVLSLDLFYWTPQTSATVDDYAQGLAAEFGGSLYFAGPLPRMYDGDRVVDVNFSMRPAVDASSFAATAASGDIDQGVYQYIVVPEWIDATGRRHQGPPSDAITVDLSASTYASNVNRVIVDVPPLHVSLKGRSEWGSKADHFAIYRTQEGPQQTFFRLETDDSPWPTSLASANFIDEKSDADIGDNEVLYISAGVVAKEPPPPTHHLIAHGDRLFGINAEDRSRIYFSAPLLPGDGPHFSSVWQIVVPAGRLTALASLDGKVYAFTRRELFLAAWGDGPSQTNAGSKFPEPQRLTSQAGATDPRSVVVGPDGIFFAGDHENETMIFLWQRGDSGIVPIGEPIRDTLATYSNITSAVLVQEQSQVRFTANDGANDSVALVYDYAERGEDGFGTWYVWDLTGNAVHAGLWDGVHTYADSVGDRVPGQVETPTTLDKTATLGHLWPAGIMTPARLKAVNVLGSVVSSSSASGKPTVSVEYSYDGGANFTATHSFAVSGAADSQFVKRSQPRRQRLTAGDIVLRLRLSNGDTSTDEIALNALMLESNPDGDGPRTGSGNRR